jgi:hypothetical protein
LVPLICIAHLHCSSKLARALAAHKSTRIQTKCPTIRSEMIRTLIRRLR